MLAIFVLLAIILIPLAIFRYPVIALAIFLTTASLKPFLLKVSFFQKVDYTVLCASLLLLSMAFDFIRSGGRLKNIINAPLCVFLALAFLLLFGMLYTSAPKYGFEKSTRFATFGLITFLAPVVLTHSIKDIRSIMWMLVVIGVIVATGTIVGQQIPVFGFSRTGFLESDVITTGENIAPAAIIAFIFAIMPNTSKRLKTFSIALIPMVVVAMILTGSRGPLVGLVLIWLAAVFICHRETSKTWQLFIVGAIVIILMISFAKLPEQVTGRIARLWSGSYELGTDVSKRTNLFSWALERFPERPVFGHGTGSFAVGYGGQDVRLYPHNIIIESLYEQGLAGGITLILFVWLIFRRWKHASKLVRLYELDIGIFQIVHTAGLLFLFSFIQAMKSGDLDSNRFMFFQAGMVVAAFGLVYRRVEEISSENEPELYGSQQIEEADFQDT